MKNYSDNMSKKYKSAESMLKGNVDCLCIFESLVENSELADIDLHIIEDELKPIYDSDELKKEIDNAIVNAILKVLKKHNIDIGYEYIEFDADELYNYIKNWCEDGIKKDSLWQCLKEYYYKEDFENDLNELVKRNLIKINKGIIKVV